MCKRSVVVRTVPILQSTENSIKFKSHQKMLHCYKCNQDYADSNFKFCPICASTLQSKAPSATTSTAGLKPFASYKCKNCHQNYVYDPNYQGDNCFYHAGVYQEYVTTTQQFIFFFEKSNWQSDFDASMWSCCCAEKNGLYLRSQSC